MTMYERARKTACTRPLQLLNRLPYRLLLRFKNINTRQCVLSFKSVLSLFFFSLPLLILLCDMGRKKIKIQPIQDDRNRQVKKKERDS